VLFKAGRKRRKKEKQKVIGFQGQNFGVDSLFQKSSDFPGFAFRVDKGDEPKFKFTGKVVIPLQLYQKLFFYATNITKEISGLGMVERVDNELRITDLFIVKQEVTTGNTTLDNKDLAQKTIDIINAGGDPTKMKLWWHSHANGTVFWSGTDDTCCDSYNNDQWLLSIVVNWKKEVLCRLDIYNPIRITLDHLPVMIKEPTTSLSALEEECKVEMKEKVKEASTAFYYGNNQPTYEPTSVKKGTWKCPLCDFEDEVPLTVVTHMTAMHNMDKGSAWQLVEHNYEGEDKIPPPFGEQPKEDVNKDTPYNYEDIYDENVKESFHGLSYHDAFDIFWQWSVADQKYEAMWGKKVLSRSEYTFLAECLATGVQVDKNLNAVV